MQKNSRGTSRGTSNKPRPDYQEAPEVGETYIIKWHHPRSPHGRKYVGTKLTITETPSHSGKTCMNNVVLPYVVVSGVVEGEPLPEHFHGVLLVEVPKEAHTLLTFAEGGALPGSRTDEQRLLT